MSNARCFSYLRSNRLRNTINILVSTNAVKRKMPHLIWSRPRDIDHTVARWSRLDLCHQYHLVRRWNGGNDVCTGSCAHAVISTSLGIHVGRSVRRSVTKTQTATLERLRPKKMKTKEIKKKTLCGHDSPTTPTRCAFNC